MNEKDSPGANAPESQTLGVDVDVAVWLTASPLIQVTVVPFIITKGLVPKACAPIVVAPCGIVTVTPTLPGWPGGETDGGCNAGTVVLFSLQLTKLARTIAIPTCNFLNILVNKQCRSCSSKIASKSRRLPEVVIN